MSETTTDTGGGAYIGSLARVRADGDVVGRDQLNIEKLIIQIYQGTGQIQLDEEALRELRDAYLAYIREFCRTLDFKGIRLPDAVEKTAGLSLRDIYVPVRARLDLPEGETWQRIAGRAWRGDEADDPERVGDQQLEPVSLEEAIRKHPALVILGDPGAGKSTLLKYLALGLAPGSDTGALPILIPLSAYSKALQENNRLSLSEFLPRYFAGRQACLQDLGALFRAALKQGRAVVMLDGLDEVVTERGRVVALVDDFIREWLPRSDDEHSPLAGNRFVATSRFVGYREAPLSDRRWLTVALVDWEKDEIETFVERFTLAVETLVTGSETEAARTRAAAERDGLLDSISAHEGIQRLAGNPLLLTILALIKRQGVTLPDRRVELYELYLETLLRSWNKARALDKTPVGPEIDFYEAWQILAPMALWLRETNPQAGLVTERQLSDFLVEYYRDEEGCPIGEARQKTRGFLDSVHRYSSLVLERGRGQYGFIHQTLEEYLAGCGLTLLSGNEAANRILKHLDEPHWHETLLLGIGALGIVRKDPRAAGALLEELLQVELKKESLGINVLLAGEALRDVGQTGVGARAARRIKDALVETMRGEAIDPRRRQEAGLLLGDIGWLPEDLDAFVVVEPGRFLYGDEQKPRTIEAPYWIARYPVTNAQFARFVENKGYQTKHWWDPVGFDWLQTEKINGPGYWNDRQWNNPLSPVVGVSWYEARAYCRWLNEKVAAEGFRVAGVAGVVALPDGYRVVLPTEEQWERAARGTDGREYPWEGEFRDSYANTGGKNFFGGLSSTTAVSAYPLGVSPTGTWDMAGNVLEWTASDYDEEARVVRGGSWFNLAENARCASRYWYPPDARLYDQGFRVAVSLVLDSDS